MHAHLKNRYEEAGILFCYGLVQAKKLGYNKCNDQEGKRWIMKKYLP